MVSNLCGLTDQAAFPNQVNRFRRSFFISVHVYYLVGTQVDTEAIGGCVTLSSLLSI